MAKKKYKKLVYKLVKDIYEYAQTHTNEQIKKDNHGVLAYICLGKEHR